MGKFRGPKNDNQMTYMFSTFYLQKIDFSHSAVNNISSSVGIENGFHWHLLTNIQTINMFCNPNKYQH